MVLAARMNDVTRMRPVALGLEGHEEAKTAEGIVFLRQGWWCRTR